MKALLYLLPLLCLPLAGCSSGERLPFVWEFTTGYPMVTTPAVEGRYAVFGSDKLYCVDAHTGGFVWSFDTFTTLTSHPIIAGNRVYFQCGGCYCLDLATGRVLWEFWTDQWGDKKPAVSEAMIVCVHGDTMYCLESGTGKTISKIPAGEMLKPPLLFGGMIVVSDQEEIRCIDAASGSIRWRLAMPGQNPWFNIAGDAERVYVPVPGGIQAYDLMSGAAAWLFPLADADQIKLCDVGKDFVYVVFGSVYCLEKKTGSIVWQYAPPHPLFAPFVSGDFLYARSMQGKLCCIDLIKRKQIWETKGLRSGTVHDGYLYRGSNTAKAYCMKLPSQ